MKQIVDNWTERPIEYWVALGFMTADHAHARQTRRDGSPYFEHPKRVAEKVELRLKPIAYLHDVVEDSDMTLEYLKNLGFPLYVLEAVDVLTHKDNEPNEVYWERIAQNPDALTVKIADIMDNLSDDPTEKQRQKYEKALMLFKRMAADK